MKLGRKILSLGLALAMSTSMMAGSFPASAAGNAKSDFASKLESAYTDPDIEYRTEVRWWMAEGAHTDETLEEEVQAMYDAGFRGVELCQLNVSGLDAETYGYGSEQWNHDFHLVLNKALDLGMTVGLTSGTNWNTANIPGMDPDSQAANQCVFQLNEELAAGSSRTGAMPVNNNLREKATFIGAYAYKKASSGNETSAIEIDPNTIIDVTEKVVLNEDNRTGTLLAAGHGAGIQAGYSACILHQLF